MQWTILHCSISSSTSENFQFHTSSIQKPPWDEIYCYISRSNTLPRTISYWLLSNLYPWNKSCLQYSYLYIYIKCTKLMRTLLHKRGMTWHANRKALWLQHFIQTRMNWKRWVVVRAPTMWLAHSTWQQFASFRSNSDLTQSVKAPKRH